jgi:DNA invertase Pin-like site-specific DNA recombinase
MRHERPHYGYIRVSSLDQAKKFSLPSQEELLGANARRNYEGAEISEWYIDKETGTTENRKDFKRLQQRIATGPPAVVHVLCVDRFARNTEDALRVSRQFYERGTKLDFVETPADLETPEGRFQFTQYAAFAPLSMHASASVRSMAVRRR